MRKRRRYAERCKKIALSVLRENNSVLNLSHQKNLCLCFSRLFLINNNYVGIEVYKHNLNNIRKDVDFFSDKIIVRIANAALLHNLQRISVQQHRTFLPSISMRLFVSFAAVSFFSPSALSTITIGF